MPYTIGFSEEKKIVIMQNTGKMSYKEYEQQSIEAVELGKARSASRFLVDCTQLITSATTMELMDFPDMYERIGAPKTNRIAMLMPKDSVTKKNAKFYETVCFNRGYSVKIFESRDEAVDWLIS